MSDFRSSSCFRMARRALIRSEEGRSWDSWKATLADFAISSESIAKIVQDVVNSWDVWFIHVVIQKACPLSSDQKKSISSEWNLFWSKDMSYHRGLGIFYDDTKEETWSSTTFLILASSSGETVPVEISSRRADWVVRCSRNSASHLVILSTGIESSYTRISMPIRAR